MDPVADLKGKEIKRATLNEVREAAKKVLILVARPLRREGGGEKGRAPKEKRFFFFP